jgi:DNA topoisomerase-1
LFTVTLDEALTLFSQPKPRRGQAAAVPLAEFGPDPVTGGPIVLREGRFGPYVTDGATNASLRKGDSLDELTPGRAAELLADRRGVAPAKKPRRVAKAAKKKR